MVAFIKVNDFVEDLIDGVHTLGTEASTIALTNTAPASETSNPLLDNNGLQANLTEIAYTNYTDDLAVDRVLEGLSTTISSGVATFDVNDTIITASGGSITTFRYVYYWNDTPTTPLNPIYAHWDNGSAIDLATGESLTLQVDALGVFTVT